MAFEDQLDLLHDGGRSLREIDGWSAEKRSRFLDGFGVDHYPLFLEKGQAEGWFAAPATLAFRNLFYKARGHELLHNVSGIAESGTMTAVLGGAGNGTQALLEVLAQAQDSSNMSGVVLLDGVQVPRDFKQRVGYVPVDDTHLPTLTVREAVLFSARQRLSADMPVSVKSLLTDIVLKLLGLSHCAETITGNQEVRGISGGEMRRLSIAVELVAGGAVLVADRPTDGLDSSAALDFVRMCRSSCRSGTSMVHSLVQPSPDLLAMYDNIVVMCRGRVVYAGALADAESYFNLLGFCAPPSKSLSDFLQSVALLPAKYHSPVCAARALRERMSSDGEAPVEGQTPNKAATATATELTLADGTTYKRGGSEAPWPATTAPISYGEDDVGAVRGPWWRRQGPAPPHPLPAQVLRIKRASSTTAAVSILAAGLRESLHWAALGQRMWALPVKRAYPREDTRARFSVSLPHQARNCVKREWTAYLRNHKAHIMLAVKSTLISLVAGTIFWQLGTGQNDMRARPGFFFFVCLSAAFTNFSIVAEVFRLRGVFFYQKQRGYYHGAAYCAALGAIHFPLGIVESLLNTAILWLTVGLSGSYVYFALLHFNLNMIAKFICILLGHVVPTEQASQVLSPISFVIQMFFAGFLVTLDKIPNAWIWMYYVSLYSQPLRGMNVNELAGLTATCDTPFATAPDGTKLCAISTGNDVLELYGMGLDDPGDDSVKWSFYGYSYIYLFFYFAVSALVITHLDLSHGSHAEPFRDVEEGDGEEDLLLLTEETGGDEEQGESRSRSETNASMHLGDPPAPITLTFRHLNYFVPVKGGEKQLLQDVYGYAKPGMLVALMGASGAGKSTLLDVLAGRKTEGRTEGSILFNGKPRDTAAFRRVAGYVEQADSHEPTATVRETILFSARTRLPRDTTTAQKEERVDEVIRTLGLTSVQDHRIGAVGAGGVPAEIRKKVTIAVELVIWPAILFLDEPTTGLDTLSALHVVRTIKALSRQICVVCTIHQPSAELFDMFDWMLLLGKGGYMAYFGQTDHMSRHFEASGLGACPAGVNAAEYALEVTGAGIAATTDRESPDDVAKRIANVYYDSEQHGAMIRATEAVEQDMTEGLRASDAQLISPMEQFAVCLQREWRISKRDLGLMRAVVGSTIMISFLSSTVYWQLGRDQEDSVNRVAVIFLAIMFATFSATSVIPTRIMRRTIFYRERASAMYGILPSFAARMVAEVPLRTVQSLIFSCTVYWATGMNDDFVRFLLFVVVMFISIHNGVAVAEAVAFLGPDGPTSTLMHTIFLVLNVLTCGFLATEEVIPTAWIWLFEANVIRFPLFYFTQNEMRGTMYGCPNNEGAIPLRTLNGTQYECPITSGEDVLAQFSISADSATGYFVGTLLIGIIFRALAMLALRYVNHVKR